MFDRVLVANRGEIALRVIRACHEVGIEALAVYSDVDKEAPFTAHADQSFPLGDPNLAESYLNIDKIVDIASKAEADAIHPGYGLLSENAAFAQACREAGLTFIGPPPSAIRAMGDKAEARELVASKGVPVIPGSPGLVREVDDASQIAEELGYPVIVKASAGGGGIGMKVVQTEDELAAALDATRRMAQTAFGAQGIILERYLPKPRHVEVQVASDGKNTIHLFERECSVQRRYQKLIEETPSMALTEDLRQAMGQAAIRVAEAVRYVNLGTVEFMFSQGDFYFLEMNTRLQVEHPITEMTTGTDLVHLQLRIAAGVEDLPRQDEVQPRGHAIECRINAEDPSKNFMPSPGEIRSWVEPGGPWVRVDSGVARGYAVPYQYDPLLAKVIVWAETREEAIARMQRSLREFQVEGITTTIPFHQAALNHAAFRSGDYDTHLVNDVDV
ncbi:MAG: acetyl-CoA carboxylase biotin carboxylase subunit [Candidatus Thermoplasmatota archaeon]|nr:acetyl-CoA carboxylase biotin carboxylase subunit [Candidatus Thermoplasmatota archaeon]